MKLNKIYWNQRPHNWTATGATTKTVEGQGQATAPRTTSSKQRSKEREEQYGSSSLEVEEEELWISIYRNPWTTPPDFRLSSERVSVELKTGVGSKRLRALRRFAWQSGGTWINLHPPPPPPKRTTDHRQQPRGWVSSRHTSQFFFFWWLDIYIARMRIEKLKVLRWSVFWRFSIATIWPNFKKIDILIHGSSR
jgi:hypothetical protein